jgi:hypothetical protein
MGTPLDIGKVISGAFQLPWTNRRAFARALAIPFALIVLLDPAWRLAYESKAFLKGGLPLLFVQALFYTVYAVTCHRLVLLDASAIAARLVPRWSWRETRFLLWQSILWFGVMVITMGATIGITLSLTDNANWTKGAWARWVFEISMIPMLYLFARFSMIFPAIAVDRKASLGWSWEMTRHNGWRLTLVVGLLPWVIGQLLGLALREESTVAESMALTSVTTLLLAVEVASLSLSYRELTAGEVSQAA